MLPLIDIAYIADELRAYSEELIEAFEDSEADGDTEPAVLVQALNDLLDGLRRLDSDEPGRDPMGAESVSGVNDIGTLGDFGIDLLSRLATLAGQLNLTRQARGLEELALPLACWIARRGGEIEHLGPVVNGAANLANRIDTPPELGRLYGLLTEVLSAVNPEVTQESESGTRTRPWRVLLVNRAIVATRSHRLDLMEEAFECIIEHMPDEAPRFFREGMEQMDALNYPPQVRALVARYHEKWCGQRVLH